MADNHMCAMSEGRLLVEKRGATGWLVFFDNPAKRNALNAAMWRGIPEALAQFETDRDVRCVVLRGFWHPRRSPPEPTFRILRKSAPNARSGKT